MSVTVYGAGGAGINLTRQIAAQVQGDAKNIFSQVDANFVYVDTSESNLAKNGIDKDAVFLFEGVDGSGKVRAENHVIIAKSTLKILQAHKPGTFNIVVCSASGGSGSVIGHSLVAELRKQGEQVVVLIVGSTGSHIEIANTLKTLKSLDKLAHDLSSPIVAHYLENSPGRKRSDVDHNVIGAALMLLMLFGSRHEELDSADLRHWLTYKALGAELIILQFASSPERYEALEDILSVATLALPDVDTSLSPKPSYHTVGLLNKAWTEHPAKFIGTTPVHYALSPAPVVAATKALQALLTEVEQQLGARVRRDSLVKDSDVATDNGLIL